MKRKLYYLIIKLTKCKPLAEFVSVLVSNILKCFYILITSMQTIEKKHSYDSSSARQKLNEYSKKPLDDNQFSELLPQNENLDLSIIIPAYNAKDTVSRCLESVLLQKTKFSYEIVIVNDGSKDNTEQIIEQYTQYEVLKLINQENKGFSGARNTGIQNAAGRYFMFLDSDDTITDNAIENLMSIAIDNDASIVVGSFSTVYENKTDETIAQDLVIQTQNDRPITQIPGGFPWGKVFKRELFLNVRFPNNYLFEDSIMAFLMYPLAQGSVVASTSKSVYNYYKNDLGITATYSTKPKCIDAYWIVEKMYEEYVKIGLPQNEYLFNLIFGHLKIAFWRTYRLNKDLRKDIFILSCDLMEKVMEYKSNKKYNLYEKNLIKAYENRDFKLWNITSLVMD